MTMTLTLTLTTHSQDDPAPICRRWTANTFFFFFFFSFFVRCASSARIFPSFVSSLPDGRQHDSLLWKSSTSSPSIRPAHASHTYSASSKIPSRYYSLPAL
ncbi:hypothetical protein IWX91DRAFT_330709, partial [Phyllosticta citricarpa]